MDVLCVYSNVPSLFAQENFHVIILYFVFQIDPKRYNDENASYLKFACVKRFGDEVTKVREDGFTLNTKDSFSISSLFCSTQLTQNGEIIYTNILF